MAQIQGNNLVYNDANGELTFSGKGITFSGAADLDMSASTGVFKTPTGATTLGGSLTIAANKDLSAATGTGAVDFSSATGTFKTSTGTNTLGGNVVISGSKTLATGTGAATLNGDTTVATAKTLAVTDADKLTVGGIIVPQLIVVSSGIIDATYDGDRFVFTAHRALQVTRIDFVQSVIENTSATTTVMVNKVPSGTAVSAGTNMLTAAVNLKTGVTANTVLNGTLHGTAGNLQLVAGDSIGLDFTNALTEYIGCITITLKAI